MYNNYVAHVGRVVDVTADAVAEVASSVMLGMRLGLNSI